MTWVKAEPSFEGLRFALHDFDERVFVGDLPPTLRRMYARPDLFIDTVGFTRLAGPPSPDEAGWFHGQKLWLNPELVAVIGNKGSGKRPPPLASTPR